jgi:hypothetical protein
MTIFNCSVIKQVTNGYDDLLDEVDPSNYIEEEIDMDLNIAYREPTR